MLVSAVSGQGHDALAGELGTASPRFCPLVIVSCPQAIRAWGSTPLPRQGNVVKASSLREDDRRLILAVLLPLHPHLQKQVLVSAVSGQGHDALAGELGTASPRFCPLVIVSCPQAIRAWGSTPLPRQGNVVKASSLREDDRRLILAVLLPLHPHLQKQVLVSAVSGQGHDALAGELGTASPRFCLCGYCIMPAGKGSSHATLGYLLSQGLMSRLCLRIIQSAVQTAGRHFCGCATNTACLWLLYHRKGIK